MALGPVFDPGGLRQGPVRGPGLIGAPDPFYGQQMAVAHGPLPPTQQLDPFQARLVQQAVQQREIRSQYMRLAHALARQHLNNQGAAYGGF